MPLPHFITTLFALLPLTALCLPSSHRELAPRDNNWHIKCGNAPNTIAGDIPVGFTPSNPISSPPPDPFPFSGSDSPWMSYLWCTPNTTTYTFFDMGQISPPPENSVGDVSLALTSSLEWIAAHLAQNGDGPVSLPTQSQTHYYYASDGPSRYAVFAQSSRGTLTFGVLHSALTGLLQFMQAGRVAASGYDKGNSPMVFQINDGQWGEVGVGYVGLLGQGKMDCVYEVVAGKGKDCADVTKGKVIG